MRVNEIFHSINGEINMFHQGSPCIFIRLQGCNLRCTYCDTPQAQHLPTLDSSMSGMTIPQIFEKMKQVASNCRIVTITGGEPFLQGAKTIHLIEELLSKRYGISVETNGTFPVRELMSNHDNDPNLSFVVDWKLPDSGESGQMDISNFTLLKKRDFVKFVVSSRDDYDEAVKQMGLMRLMQIPVTFAMSANKAKISPRWGLLEWMFRDQIPAVFNVQLHKYLDDIK